MKKEAFDRARSGVMLILGVVLTLAGSLIPIPVSQAADEPIVITTQEELENVFDNLDGNYRLGNDIVLNNITPDSGYYIGNGWGNDYFTGSFDGSNFTISNLSVPLFQVIGDGRTSLAVVSHLKLATVAEGFIGVGILAEDIHEQSAIDDVHVSGTLNQMESSPVGGLAGRARPDTTINNCSSEVTITLNSNNGDDVGGLIGSTQGTISNSFSKVSITGIARGNIGGLVGFVEDGSEISNSATSGNITGDGDVENTNFGGLVGMLRGSIVRNTSSSVTIFTGQDSYVGGLIGRIESSDSDVQSVISYSNASGNVTNHGFTVGGLIGFTDKVLVSHCYATGAATGIAQIGGLIGYAESTNIENSAATGAVKGSKYLGGLIGYTSNYYSIELLVSGSSASGEVTLTSGAIPGMGSSGALIGYLDTNVFLTNVRASGNVSLDDPTLQVQNIGGLVGQYDSAYSILDESGYIAEAGLLLLNHEQAASPPPWMQSININFGEPYLVALAESNFYEIHIVVQTPSAHPEQIQKKPSYFLLIRKPSIERTTLGLTCNRGEYLFIRESERREGLALKEQNFILVRSGQEVAKVSTSESETSFTKEFLKLPGTYSCVVQLNQEGVTEMFSTLNPRRVQELNRIKNESLYVSFRVFLKERRSASTYLAGMLKSNNSEYIQLRQKAISNYVESRTSVIKAFSESLAREGISIDIP